MEKRYSIRQLVIIVFVVFILTAAISFTAFSVWNYYKPKYEIEFDPKTVNSENINKFNQVRAILKDDYYKNVDENILIEGAVSGLADSLKDPYTVYFNKEQMQSFLEKSEGSYVGVGISINTDSSGLLTIIEPFEGSPAKAAGLQQGDKIIQVDGKDVTAIRDENMIVSMIKGEENTKVSITVYRPSENKNIIYEMKRKKIKVSNIKSEILQNNIGYIKLTMFDSEIAGYFIKDLNNLLAKGIKSLIIDLRDNPGGSYEQVVEIADRLLPEGLIVYTEDRNKVRQEKKSDKTELGLPIAVLINENSASASEILAGALKDHGKGKLVGIKSFGKGLVQELKVLGDGSGIKVTISRYFTPSGVCIQDIGIKPDIEIDVMSDYRDKPVSQVPRDNDVQLKSAIEAVSAQMQQ